MGSVRLDQRRFPNRGAELPAFELKPETRDSNEIFVGYPPQGHPLAVCGTRMP